MSSTTSSLQEMLSGPRAFYSKSNYEELARKELVALDPPELPELIYNTENQAWRITKDIACATILFPIGLGQLVHSYIGKRAFLPAADPVSLGLRPNYSMIARRRISVTGLWKVKRLAVQVDGYVVDAAVIGQAATLGNRRWVLVSNGNAQFYEDTLESPTFLRFLSRLNANALVFNYPGVGASSGLPSRGGMAISYRAMLELLEDPTRGIGARQIIGYGHSIGGAVQGEGLDSHLLKRGIRYCFVKSRTFSDMSTTAACITRTFTHPSAVVTALAKPERVGCLVGFFCWNMRSVESSKKLTASEIIIQTARVPRYTDIGRQPGLVIDDGIIPGDASLTRELLKGGQQHYPNKLFLGVPETHNEDLTDTGQLVGHIERMLLGEG